MATKYVIQLGKLKSAYSDIKVEDNLFIAELLYSKLALARGHKKRLLVEHDGKRSLVKRDLSKVHNLR